MVKRYGLTLVVPDLPGRPAAVTGASSGLGFGLARRRGFYEAARGAVFFAHMPRLTQSRDDLDRVWRLSEQLTGVTYPP
jgi:NAD(P)-dependent dehydrogenase (short-subunit alcohol dehydrogenase family)